MIMKDAPHEEQAKYTGSGLESEAERAKYANKTPTLFKGGKTKRMFWAVMWNQEGERFYTRVKGAWESVFRDKSNMEAFGNTWTEWVRDKRG